MKKLILWIYLLSSSVFAGEEANSETKRKFDICVVKSLIYREHELKKCRKNGNTECILQVHKEWIESMELCVQNSKETASNVEDVPNEPYY